MKLAFTVCIQRHQTVCLQCLSVIQFLKMVDCINQVILKQKVQIVKDYLCLYIYIHSDTAQD